MNTPHLPLPNHLSLLPSSNPRASLAAHSNVSDSACFQRGADALSIIIRGFAESWGLGNLPGCVKVSMRKALSCLQKHLWWTEILRKVRMPFLLPEAGKEEATTILFSVWENKPSRVSNANLELRRKQSRGKLPCNARQSEHICQMSEIGRGCVALCVFLILGNKGPLFPREAAGRNLALWLALVPLLCAAFSCISWYHPSQQQLMRQDTRQRPHRTKLQAQPAHYLCSAHTHPQQKIPINTRNRVASEGFAISNVAYILQNCLC